MKGLQLVKERPEGIQAVARRHRILLVEDDPVNQQVTIGLLEKLACRKVDIVGDGRAALDALTARDYQLVLMDLSMPGLDGFETTNLIRCGSGGVRNPEVPIIALTAHAMEGVRDRCLTAGMNGYVSKPLSMSSLEKALGAAWPEEELELVDILQPGGKEAVAIPVEEKARVLDYDELVARLDGDVETADLILTELAMQLPLQFADLAGCVEDGDCAQAGRLAHKMKGAAANVGADYLCGVLAELEQYGETGQLFQIRELLPTAGDGMDRLLEEITVLRSAAHVSSITAESEAGSCHIFRQQPGRSCIVLVFQVSNPEVVGTGGRSKTITPSQKT